MSGSRSRCARARGGGRPSHGQGIMRAGTGDIAASSTGGVAGGGAARIDDMMRLSHQQRQRLLRSSPGEERAARMEIERGLRLRRLDQVRQQSRKQACAVREEYRRRQEENERAALQESKRQFEDYRAAELLTLNQKLQANLLEVGTAHRMAVSRSLAREVEEERLRAKRSASAERRRSRTLLAAKKKEAEMRGARRDIDAAHYRQDVWNDAGGEERARVRQEAARQEAAAAARRARDEFGERQLQQRADKGGVVKTTQATVVQVGPRLEDFKTSRVHTALVLKHGNVPGARLMGVETTVGDPSQELERVKALQKEREEKEEEADYRAVERGHEAFLKRRDERAAASSEAELKRLFDLDRRHRLMNGAAETNLAALREREIRRARFGGPHGAQNVRVPGAEMTNLRGRRRPATGDLEQGVPGLAPEIDDREWREWPAWWPTPPPPPAAAGDGWPGTARPIGPSAVSSSALPSRRGLAVPPEPERLRLIRETRQRLVEAAARAQEQGSGGGRAFPAAAAAGGGGDGVENVGSENSGVFSSPPESGGMGGAKPAMTEVAVVGEASPSVSGSVSGAAAAMIASVGSGPRGLQQERQQQQRQQQQQQQQKRQQQQQQQQSSPAPGARRLSPIHERRRPGEDNVTPLVGGITSDGSFGGSTEISSQGGRVSMAELGTASASAFDDSAFIGRAGRGGAEGSRDAMAFKDGVRFPHVQQNETDHGWNADSEGSEPLSRHGGGGGGSTGAAATESTPALAPLPQRRPVQPAETAALAHPPLGERTGETAFEGGSSVGDPNPPAGGETSALDREAAAAAAATSAAAADAAADARAAAASAAASAAEARAAAAYASANAARPPPPPGVSVGVNTPVEVMFNGQSAGTGRGRDSARGFVSVDAAVQVRLSPSPFGGGHRQSLLAAVPAEATTAGAARRYAGFEKGDVRNTGSGGSGAGSPFKPVALRPRPSRPASFDATAPYNSLFSRSRNEGEREDAKASDEDGAPPRLGGNYSGRASPWSPPDTAAVTATAAAGADAGSSLLAEAGSVGVVMSPPPLSRRDGSGVREEGRWRAEAATVASVLPPHRNSWSGGEEGWGGVPGGAGEEGSLSVGSSSTSTLPQLDQELSELLERHRRLDREAALLTRQAEADAYRWHDSNTLSSLTPRSPSSSPGHKAATATVSYSSRYGEGGSGRSPNTAGDRKRASAQGSPSEGGDEFLAPPGGRHSSPSRSLGDGGRSGQFRSGMGVTEAGAGETRLGAGDRGSGRGGIIGDASTGGRAAASSWDRELARTVAREGSAAPGWSSRWQPGVAGSRAALGLWERAGGLDGDEGAEGEAVAGVVSRRGNVDTAQEVTEWARRIQASIESMNRLVDGFQLSGGGGSSGAAGVNGDSGSPGDGDDGASTVNGNGSAGTVTTPGSSVSGLNPDDSSRSSGSGTSDSAAHAMESRSRRFGGDASAEVAGGAIGALSSSLPAHGLESFASAQLGFRRGLEGLVKRGVGGGAGLQEGSSLWRHLGSGTARAAAAGNSSSSSSSSVSDAFRPFSFSSAVQAGESTPAEHLSAHRSHEAEETKSGSTRGWVEEKGGESGRPSRRVGGSRKGDGRSSLSLSSSSSVIGRADAVLAAAARDAGFDGTGGGGGGGGDAGSVSSLSSSNSRSLGPDLEAEIASLEALAESLQQRKMRLEPKPALLMQQQQQQQQQQELEDHRRAIRATSVTADSLSSRLQSSFVALHPIWKGEEGGDEDRKSDGVQRPVATDTDSNAGADSALAALEAFEAELDAREDARGSPAPAPAGTEAGARTSRGHGSSLSEERRSSSSDGNRGDGERSSNRSEDRIRTSDEWDRGGDHDRPRPPLESSDSSSSSLESHDGLLKQLLSLDTEAMAIRHRATAAGTIDGGAGHPSLGRPSAAAVVEAAVARDGQVPAELSLRSSDAEEEEEEGREKGKEDDQQPQPQRQQQQQQQQQQQSQPDGNDPNPAIDVGGGASAHASPSDAFGQGSSTTAGSQWWRRGADGRYSETEATTPTGGGDLVPVRRVPPRVGSAGPPSGSEEDDLDGGEDKTERGDAISGAVGASRGGVSNGARPPSPHGGGSPRSFPALIGPFGGAEQVSPLAMTPHGGEARRGGQAAAQPQRGGGGEAQDSVAGILRPTANAAAAAAAAAAGTGEASTFAEEQKLRNRRWNGGSDGGGDGGAETDTAVVLTSYSTPTDHDYGGGGGDGISRGGGGGVEVLGDAAAGKGPQRREYPTKGPPPPPGSPFDSAAAGAPMPADSPLPFPLSARDLSLDADLLVEPSRRAVDGGDEEEEERPLSPLEAPGWGSLAEYIEGTSTNSAGSAAAAWRDLSAEQQELVLERAGGIRVGRAEGDAVPLRWEEGDTGGASEIRETDSYGDGVKGGASSWMGEEGDRGGARGVRGREKYGDERGRGEITASGRAVDNSSDCAGAGVEEKTGQEAREGDVDELFGGVEPDGDVPSTAGNEEAEAVVGAEARFGGEGDRDPSDYGGTATPDISGGGGAALGIVDGDLSWVSHDDSFDRSLGQDEEGSFGARRGEGAAGGVTAFGDGSSTSDSHRSQSATSASATRRSLVQRRGDREGSDESHSEFAPWTGTAGSSSGGSGGSDSNGGGNDSESHGFIGRGRASAVPGRDHNDRDDFDDGWDGYGGARGDGGGGVGKDEFWSRYLSEEMGEESPPSSGSTGEAAKRHGAAGDGAAGEDTIMTEDSLKFSEPSLDSLAMAREGSAGEAREQAAARQRFPRAGVAASWELGSSGSRQGKAEPSRPAAARGEADQLEERDAGGGVGGGGGGGRLEGEEGEGEGGLAAIFNSRASAFISRSRAREEAVRRRRDSRQKAREDAEAVAAAAAAEKRQQQQQQQREREDQQRGREGDVSAAAPPSGLGETIGARRRVSIQEARKRTARLYNTLPEVREAREKKLKSEERVRRLLEARAQEKSRHRRFRRGGGR